MKNSLYFYACYLIISVIDLLIIYSIDYRWLMITTFLNSFLCIYFYLKHNISVKTKLKYLVIGVLASITMAEFFALFRENKINYFIMSLFSLAAIILAFAFLDYRSIWRKKVLSNKKMLIVVPFAFLFLYGMNAYLLTLVPNTSFIPLSLTVILFLFVFLSAIFRKTNTESYYYILASCLLFCVCFSFYVLIPENYFKNIFSKSSGVIFIIRGSYLLAKFCWVMGCVWAIKALHTS